MRCNRRFKLDYEDSDIHPEQQKLFEKKNKAFTKELNSRIHNKTFKIEKVAIKPLNRFICERCQHFNIYEANENNHCNNCGYLQKEISKIKK